MKKMYSFKNVSDASYLTLNTDQPSESSSLDPLITQLAKANKKYKSAIDPFYANSHAALDDDTFKQTRVSAAYKLFCFH